MVVVMLSMVVVALGSMVVLVSGGLSKQGTPGFMACYFGNIHGSAMTASIEIYPLYTMSE